MVANSLVGAACVTALLLSYAGMAGLCLAMDRHHDQVWGCDASPTTRRLLRSLGWLLLCFAVVPCVQAWGGAVGVVVWLGFLSTAALLFVAMLSATPRAAAWAALLAALLGSSGTGLLLLAF